MKEQFKIETVPEEKNLDQFVKDRGLNFQQEEYLNNLVSQIVELKQGKTFAELKIQAENLKTVKEKREMIERLKKLKALLDSFENILKDQAIVKVNGNMLKMFFDSLDDLDDKDKFSWLLTAAENSHNVLPEIYEKVMGMMQDLAEGGEDENLKFRFEKKLALHKIKKTDDYGKAKELLDEFMGKIINPDFFKSLPVTDTLGDRDIFYLCLELAKRNNQLDSDLMEKMTQAALNLTETNENLAKYLLEDVAEIYLYHDRSEGQDILDIVVGPDPIDPGIVSYISNKVYMQVAKRFIKENNFAKAREFIINKIEDDDYLCFLLSILEQMAETDNPDLEKSAKEYLELNKALKKEGILDLQLEAMFAKRLALALPMDMIESLQIGKYCESLLKEIEEISNLAGKRDFEKMDYYPYLSYLEECFFAFSKINQEKSLEILEKIKKTIFEALKSPALNSNLCNYYALTLRRLAGIVDPNLNAKLLKMLFADDASLDDLEDAFSYFTEINDKNADKILKKIKTKNVDDAQRISKLYLNSAIIEVF